MTAPDRSVKIEPKTLAGGSRPHMKFAAYDKRCETQPFLMAALFRVAILSFKQFQHLRSGLRHYWNSVIQRIPNDLERFFSVKVP